MTWPFLTLDVGIHLSQVTGVMTGTLKYSKPRIPSTPSHLTQFSEASDEFVYTLLAQPWYLQSLWKQRDSTRAGWFQAIMFTAITRFISMSMNRILQFIFNPTAGLELASKVHTRHAKLYFFQTEIRVTMQCRASSTSSFGNGFQYVVNIYT
jgi:hypothetical protein